ncbi:MAG: hypothetical protein M1831_000775 [Alyxoria varia]|nr:MAG: hypothetical protein M1831_000775 [Alyxoria varia]
MSRQSTFPPPNLDVLDWNNIGFHVRDEASALNYGQQWYEGLKAFRHPSDTRITIFRPSQNALRMQTSARTNSMPPVPTSLFLRCVHAAVSLNAEFVPPHATGAVMYIRPLLFGSGAQLGLSPPEEYLFLVYCLPVGVYHGLHSVDALILEDFDRAAPRGVGSFKVGGNYAPVFQFSQKAKSEGFGITLHLDSATRSEIDEFRTDEVIYSVDGDSVTLIVPSSSQIIKSITSDSVRCIAREKLGWYVEERPVAYEELPEFCEVMAAGTAAGLVPIRSITYRIAGVLARGPRVQSIPGNEPDEGQKIVYQEGDDAGPVCKRLLGLLRGIQSGQIELPCVLQDWLLGVTAVQVPEIGEITEDEEVFARLAEYKNGHERSLCIVPVLQDAWICSWRRSPHLL